ncbi:MAG: hypothetical protein HYZ75_01405 [Elusimicrobia bacterium]|nr:hypothetical protein [Elusimicrobiota bacterium]
MNTTKFTVIGFTAAVLGMMALSPVARAANPAPGSSGAAAGQAAGEAAAVADQPADEKTESSSGGCCG